MSTPRIDSEMEQALSEKVFPGAALLVASKGEVLYRKFFGHATLIPKEEPVTEKTIFDVASLTKPVATAALAMLAVREKGLSLNSQISKYFSVFDAEDKSKITIRHLLKHTSGLPAWRPYFEDIRKEHPELVGQRESRAIYVAKISEEALERPVAYQRIYSDLGFILLGILLEDFCKKSIDWLFGEKIVGPLDLKNTFFVPAGAALTRPQEDFAATEDSAWRGKLIRGEVHDDNAYVLGGVAGHAGLFSTADDLHRFLVTIEQALREGHPLLPQELATDFLGPKVKLKLGWDTPLLDGSQAGKYFSRNSIGHLGYTGCSFWADLEMDFHVILLTNRVHPSSQNEAIQSFRPKIHDVIYEELIAKR